jgi:hypothetical protein
MIRRQFVGIAFALASLSVSAAPPAVVRYVGPCDASAAAALGADTFIVANDETNTLYIYKRGQPQPIDSIPVTKFLGSKARDEADIEGAAAIGQRVYWITSHARDSKGKSRPGRRRFFATEMGGDDPKLLTPVGKPYVNLQHDMLEAPQLARYHLSDAERLPPEAPGGFNIEGLAATPAGGLLIGLRNPLFEGRALVIPFDNPADVVGGDRAQFGTAYEFDLGGRGVRSIERVGSSYLIVAGPIADEGTFALYRWSGARDNAPKALNVDLGTLRPEALIAVPDTAQVQLFSDDGGVETADGVACKKLEFAQQTFRSVIITPP